MNDEIINELYKRAGTPEHVVRHMQAVADFQDQLLDKLAAAGLSYDRDLLRCAALLHDVCRTEHNHAKAGADFLEREGFTQIADIVRDHHSPANDIEVKLTPSDILYYADKRVQGDMVVTVQERFDASLSKCRTPEAIEKHDALLSRALAIEEAIRAVISERSSE